MRGRIEYWGQGVVYRLYGVADFANLAVQIALEELGQPYEAVFLDAEAGALKSPEHLARHPLGLVPVLETPDGMLFETAAILLWLADRHGQLAPAPATADRGRFLTWFVFTNNSIHTAAMDLLHPQRAAGEAHRLPVATAAHARLRERLALLDGVARERPEWLSPDRPGILGIYLSMLLRWIRLFPAFPQHAIALRDYPALQAIVAACEIRPATQRVAPAHGLAGRFLSDPAG